MNAERTLHHGPWLEADSVGKSFGDRRVLTSASLRAVPGRVCAIFGRNGTGKSTLVKIAAGVIQSDTGSVRLKGETVLHPSFPRMTRRGVFYLPDHDILSNTFTLGQQLGFFERRFGRRSAADAAAAADVEHVLHRRPQTLSGGELRRAELAAALTRRPDCLLADEPFRGIAPVDHPSLAAVFRGMAADGCAVVVTGHEVPSLLEFADTVLWCTSGTSYDLGTSDAACRHEAFQKEYLGPAGMRAPRAPREP